jgi:hypothetical protein
MAMRLNAQTAMMMNGFVHLPEKAHWLPVYLPTSPPFPRQNTTISRIRPRSSSTGSRAIAPPTAPPPRTLQSGSSRRNLRSAQPVGEPAWPLRRDHADLGQVAAQAVRQLRALANQHLACLVAHQRRLVQERAHADKPHRRPPHGFANRRRVGRVVLLPPNIRLDIGRRHHPCVMAKLDQLARPVMRRRAGFEPDKTWGQRSEKLQELVAPDRLGDRNAPQSINAVNLKNLLGQIEPNGRDRRQSMIGLSMDGAPLDALL